VVTTASPLGFSITNAFKTVARDTYSVASDPRAQALVAAGAQAYAPGATSQVMQVTHTVQDDIRRARKFWDHGQPVIVQPGQMPPPGATLDPGPDGDGQVVQNSHMLVFAGIGAGVLLLLLLMKR
jgi:hypothetical protein